MSEPSGGSPLPKKPVVILMHGIRDYGGQWMVDLKDIMEAQGADVRLFTESYVSAFFFILPKWVRSSFEKKIRAKLARRIADHANTELLIFAHSYGTFLLTETLRENSKLHVKRAVLYGAVVHRDFDWYDIANCFDVKSPGDPFPILNWCGNRDTWPVAAECLSPDYGSSGTRGFMNGHIQDFFSEGDHNSFLRGVFAKDWIPYLLRGVPPGPSAAQPLPHHDVVRNYNIGAFLWRTMKLRHIVGAVYKFRSILLVLALLSVICAIGVWWWPDKHCVPRPDVTIERFIIDLDEARVSDDSFRVFSEPFSSGRCWHVKWRVQIKNGSQRDSKRQWIVVEPVEPVPGLTRVQMDDFMIKCDLSPGKNWGAFGIGESVLVEGDTEQILPKLIYLKNCSVSIDKPPE